jgi:hypothetical protein
LQKAQEFEMISPYICKAMISAIEAGLYVLPKRQAKVVLENLQKLY